MDNILYSLALGPISQETALTSLQNYLTSKDEQYHEFLAKVMSNSNDVKDQVMSFANKFVNVRDIRAMLNSTQNFDALDILKTDSVYWYTDDTPDIHGINAWRYLIKILAAYGGVDINTDNDSIIAFLSDHTDYTYDEVNTIILNVVAHAPDSDQPFVQLLVSFIETNYGVDLSDVDPLTPVNVLNYLLGQAGGKIIMYMDAIGPDFMSSDGFTRLMNGQEQLISTIQSFIDSALVNTESVSNSAADFLSRATFKITDMSDNINTLVNAGTKILDTKNLSLVDKVRGFISLVDGRVLDGGDAQSPFADPNGTFTGLSLTSSLLDYVDETYTQIKSWVDDFDFTTWEAQVQQAALSVGIAMGKALRAIDAKLNEWDDKFTAWAISTKTKIRDFWYRTFQNPIDVEIITDRSDDQTFDVGYNKYTITNGAITYSSLYAKLQANQFSLMVVPWLGMTMYVQGFADSDDIDLYIKKHCYRADAVERFFDALSYQGVTISEVNAAILQLCSESNIVEGPHDSQSELDFFKSLVLTEVLLNASIMVFLSGWSTWLQINQQFTTEGSWAFLWNFKWFNSLSKTQFNNLTSVTNTQFLNEVVYGNYTNASGILNVINSNLVSGEYNIPYFMSASVLQPRFHILTDDENMNHIVHTLIIIGVTVAAIIALRYAIPGLISLKRAAYAANIQAGVTEFGQAKLTDAQVITARKSRIKANILGKLAGSTEVVAASGVGDVLSAVNSDRNVVYEAITGHDYSDS